MAPNSNNSSIDGQNGSAYSNADFTSQWTYENSIYQTGNATEAQCPAGLPHYRATLTPQQASHETYTMANGYQPENRNEYATEYSDSYSYRSGDQSLSATTFSSSEQEHEVQWDGQGYEQYGQYYLSTTSYPPQEAPIYEPKLVIDSIEDDHSKIWTDPSLYPSHEDEVSHASSGDAASRVHRIPVKSRYTQQSQTENVAGTEATMRWSREYSPEERMRVGLPRFPTEQHRVDYERQQSHQRQSRQ